MNPATRPAAALLFAAIISLAFSPQPARAQGPTGAGAASVTQQGQDALAASALGKPSATAEPALADLAWLIGSWQGTWGPRFAQQSWTAPRAGVMLGTFQITENDKTLVIELFSLSEGPSGIELRIRHFTPSLVPWEKDGPTVLRLASADAKSAVFENPTSGEPKTQSFRRVDADTFVWRSEVVPQQGDPQISEIAFRHARAEAVPIRKPAKKSN